MTMDDKSYNNVYAIPANYTDSGKILGGMLELRNALEAGILLLLVGYPELMWLPVAGTIKIVVMTLTLLPLGVLAVMGVDGDSLFQGLCHVLAFAGNRRKIHMKRVGYPYDPKKERKKEKRKKADRPGVPAGEEDTARHCGDHGRAVSEDTGN